MADKATKETATEEKKGLESLAALKETAAKTETPEKEPADESASSTTNEAVKREPKRDKQGRAYATGKRKDAVARVWVKPGTGNIIVNKKPANDYFTRPTLQMVINQPFDIVSKAGQFDVVVTVAGGGLSGQAGAVKHGVSRALVNYDPEFRPALKSAGFLTRDARVVERKKYGKRKARRSFQFSKR